MLLIINMFFILYNIAMFFIEGGFSSAIASRIIWILLSISLGLFQIGFISLKKILRKFSNNDEKEVKIIYEPIYLKKRMVNEKSFASKFFI